MQGHSKRGGAKCKVLQKPEVLGEVAVTNGCEGKAEGPLYPGAEAPAKLSVLHPSFRNTTVPVSWRSQEVVWEDFQDSPGLGSKIPAPDAHFQARPALLATGTPICKDLAAEEKGWGWDPASSRQRKVF